MPAINLLPKEVAARVRERRMIRGIIGGGVAVVLLLGVVFLMSRAREARERETLEGEQAQVAALQAEVAALVQFEQLNQRVEQRRATLTSALVNDVAWSKFLSDVSLIMPDNSWLSSMTMSSAVGTAPNAVPSIGTVAFSGFTFDFAGLAGWLTRMAQIEGLTFVYLSSGSRPTATDIVTFGANASLTQNLLSRRCEQGQRCP